MRKAERSAVTIRRPWRYAACGVSSLYPDLLFRFHDTIVAEELFHLNAGNIDPPQAPQTGPVGDELDGKEEPNPDPTSVTLSRCRGWRADLSADRTGRAAHTDAEVRPWVCTARARPEPK